VIAAERGRSKGHLSEWRLAPNWDLLALNESRSA
jgi:hypothetical protein